MLSTALRPKFCEFCNKELIKKDKEKLNEFNRRRFCGLTCVAQWRRSQALIGVERYCLRCGKKLEIKSNEEPRRFKLRKYCSKKLCIEKVKKEKKPYKKCRVCGNLSYKTYCSNQCKREFWESKPKKPKMKKPIYRTETLDHDLLYLC